MKNYVLIAFVILICVSIWGIVILNIAQNNGTINERVPVEEDNVVEIEAVDLVPSTVERYYEQGITREDAKRIAPDGVIPVDELLDIVEN